MPTSKLKNIVYRAIYPLKAPKLGAHPAVTAVGHHLYTYNNYAHLLKKHHVMGSAALLDDGDHRTMIISSSDYPEHLVSRNSMFRVASITKMASALAALVAVEDGKLDMNEPILSFLHLSEKVDELQDVTLQHLLTHTSGLTDPPELESFLLNGLPFTEAVRGCQIASPGTVFHYSNLGFGLIGCLLEAVYSKPVSVILRQHVFLPLSMRATLEASSLPTETIVPISRIYPFHPGMDTVITPYGQVPLKFPDPLRHYGHTAGSMYVDVESLALLMHCLMNEGKPLLQPKLGQLISVRHSSYGRLDPKLHYGLGLLIIQDPSLSPSRILGHQGFAYGCADGAFWEEDSGRLVIFLNGGCSEARKGRLGLCNYDILKWALNKEFPKWFG